MGDTVVHGFSYASAIPNESKQGNPMHALGESISFGRYMNESLSWEKWSTFSHKKYVEEAERYAQPGSVAQKKAFFEAHYKKIAAQKAAALLEQENAAKKAVEVECTDSYIEDEEKPMLDNPRSDEIQDDNKVAHEQSSVVLLEIIKENESSVIREFEASVESPVRRKSTSQLDNLENLERISASESSGTSQMERPLLKNSSDVSEDMPSVMSKKKSSILSLKSSIQRKTWRIPATPLKPVCHFDKENNAPLSTKKSNADTVMDKNNRSSPKSLRALINLIPNKGSDKEPISATKKNDSSGIVRNPSRLPKDCLTPLRTPIVAASKGFSKYPSVTPISENRRKITPVDPSGGSKTAGPKWHILSAVSKSLTACKKKLETPSSSTPSCKKKLQTPTSTTPFLLRTEERAAKRKQRLDEKFNANEAQKVQQPQRTLKEKAGNEFRKLGNSFCFKARPLPDFYKDREIPRSQMKKAPTAQSQPVVMKRSVSNKKQGTISMPPPPPVPSYCNKTVGVSKNLSRTSTPTKKLPTPRKSAIPQT